MGVKVTGVREARNMLDQLLNRVDDVPEYVAEVLADDMTDVVHVQSGYLRSTIYHRQDVAGATAPYAAIEAERGGSHDFPGIAIDRLDDEQLADWIMEGL